MSATPFEPPYPLHVPMVELSDQDLRHLRADVQHVRDLVDRDSALSTEASPSSP